MKKFTEILIIFFLLFTPLVKVKGESAYDTFTIDAKGNFVPTQEAFTAIDIINLDLKNPSDLFIDQNNNFYIADTDNHRIVKYDQSSEEITYLGDSVLESPTGVHVTQDNLIYVADFIKEEIVVLDTKGNLIKSLARPDEIYYGEDIKFKPRKVVVDENENIYVITEGGVNGIVQLNSNGDFLGYFGANSTKPTLKMIIQRAIFSEKQLSQLAQLIPPSPTNIAIDKESIVYPIYKGQSSEALRKLNLNGTNVLFMDYNSDSLIDITVDNDGNIYTIDENEEGNISIHDSFGNLLFRFGEKNTLSMRLGQFINPSSIAVDTNGNISVLDYRTGSIQIFTKTEFGDLVFQGVKLFKDGKYTESQGIWEDVLKQNPRFALAHVGLGKAYLKNSLYHDALREFRLGNSMSDYSETYWEIRNIWLQHNIMYFIGILIIFIFIKKWFNRHKQSYELYKKYLKTRNKILNTTLFKELFYLKHILKHPVDTFYDIKNKRKVSVKTGLLLYVVLSLVVVLSTVIKGYLFRGELEQLSLLNLALSFTAPLLIFTVANHLMSSLQNGEGFYRDIFIGAIISFSPIILFSLPLSLITNFLTLNEGFIYTFAYNILFIWSVINLILMVKEIHNYKMKTLILNLLLTLFTIIILIVLFVIINILTTQMIQFFEGIIKEVRLNA
ncbi:YIP1 family protein [Mycoplasmatota bacterium]|nr:YIP1 family protein [Mycoplasmatota bacterium]